MKNISNLLKPHIHQIEPIVKSIEDVIGDVSTEDIWVGTQTVVSESVRWKISNYVEAEITELATGRVIRYIIRGTN